MPKASPEAVRLFAQLADHAPGASVRKMFGQPAAFVNGNMFLGVFGNDVFLRLSDGDRTAAAKIAGVRPFEPMPGRAMREYLVFPPALLEDPKRSLEWLKRSLAYSTALAPKAKKR